MKYLAITLVDYPGDPDDAVNTDELEHSLTESGAYWLGGCVPEKYMNDDLTERIKVKVVEVPDGDFARVVSYKSDDVKVAGES